MNKQLLSVCKRDKTLLRLSREETITKTPLLTTILKLKSPKTNNKLIDTLRRSRKRFKALRLLRTWTPPQPMSRRMQSLRESSQLSTWWKKCSSLISPLGKPFLNIKRVWTTCMARSSKCKLKMKLSEKNYLSLRKHLVMYLKRVRKVSTFLRYMRRKSCLKIEWRYWNRPPTIGLCLMLPACSFITIKKSTLNF